MSRLSRAGRFGAALALAVALGPGIPAAAQSYGVERTYSQSQDAVEKAVDGIRPTAKGRLPTLDGFVGTTEQPLERYKSGYYDCAIKVSPGGSGGTVVRVTAKITAWYTDSNPAKSGYRTLPSNGRLENDLLDRLSDVLEPGGAQSRAAPPPTDAAPSTPQSLPSGALRPPATGLPAHPLPGTEGLAPLPAAGGAGRAAQPGVAATPSSAPPATTEAERAQAEQHAKELRALADNLEEILRNQAHPENLAAVRKSGTPVYARPQAGAEVLFAAEAQDEFQILEVQATWVHVQISGASRGWIRRGELELPVGFAPSAAAGASTPAGGVAFQVTRENVKKFPGDWQPLAGKLVKMFDVEPTAGMATSAKEKRAFAKSLLVSVHPESTSGGETLAGVVVVFDSADGGQISAILADVKLLQEGHITEAAFWHRCSLDPPEAFQEAGKP